MKRLLGTNIFSVKGHIVKICFRSFSFLFFFLCLHIKSSALDVNTVEAANKQNEKEVLQGFQWIAPSGRAG